MTSYNAIYVPEKCCSSPQITIALNEGGGGGSQYAWNDVRKFGALGNGINDDTTAFLTAMSSCNNSIYIPVSSGSYMISKPIPCPSNTYIKADPNATITLASGSNCIMLIDATTNAISTSSPASITGGTMNSTASSYYQPNVTAQSNITIDGGIWNQNWTNNNSLTTSNGSYALYSNKTGTNLWVVCGCTAVFEFCNTSFLTIKNVTISNAASFNIQIAGCKNVTLENITLLQGQNGGGNDGLHLNGPLSNVEISNVDGIAGDDFIALNAIDWLTSSPFSSYYQSYTGSLISSNITDVNISDVICTSTTSSAVKITTTSNTYVTGYVWRINIRNVSGSTTRAFYWGNDENNSAGVVITQGGSLRDISVENVSLSTGTVNTFSYPLVNIHTNYNNTTALDVQDITIKNVTIDQYAPVGPVVYIGNFSALGFQSGGSGCNVTNLAIDGVFISATSNFNNSILTTADYHAASTGSVVNFNTISISNVVSKLSTLTYPLVNLNTGQLGMLTVDKCQWLVSAGTNSDSPISLCGISCPPTLSSIEVNLTNSQFSHPEQIFQIINTFTSAPSPLPSYIFSLIGTTCRNAGNVAWVSNGGTYTNGGAQYALTISMLMHGCEMNNTSGAYPLYRIMGLSSSCASGSTLKVTSLGNQLTGGNVHTSFLALNNAGLSGTYIYNGVDPWVNGSYGVSTAQLTASACKGCVVYDPVNFSTPVYCTGTSWVAI